jgi:hypothetical protein
MHYTVFFALLFVAVAACRQTTKPGETTGNETFDTAAPAIVETNSAVKKLYVHAAKGLVLRKSPSKDGEKITTLIYGSPALEVLETVTDADRFVAERFDGQNIEGEWLRVRSHDGKEGYVFGSYLSRYPPVTESAEEGVEELDWFYRTISSIQGEREKTQQPHALDGYLQNYADGARFDSAFFPGGVAHLLDIPPGKLGFQEAFVMLRSFVFTRPDEIKSSFDRKRNAFVAVHEAEGYVTLVVSQKPDGGLAVELSFPD